MKENFVHNVKKDLLTKPGILLGACLSWCLFNITAYGQGTFSAIIYETMFGEPDESMRITVLKAAYFVLAQGFFCILGGLFGLWLELRGQLPRRATQWWSFVGMGITMWLSTTLWGMLPESFDTILFLLQFVWYACTSLVGITTYLVPTENFPRSVRATAVGVAAASGKFGAAVGTLVFPISEDHFGLKPVLFVSGCVSLIGAQFTSSLTPAESSAGC